jgi:hypothetical protein
MTQTEARKLAKERSEATGLIFIAITEDRAAGRWENTNKWGIQLLNTGQFWSELPQEESV